MRRSIKHLPKRTQEELNILLELILKHLQNVEMVQLYGSYARGNYVLWDQRVEFGVNTSYQSDLDIMVVIRKGSTKIMEDTIRNLVKPAYDERLSHRRHAIPRIIVEYLDVLNEKLDLSQYFYTEVIRTGIRIYDTNKYTLAKPRPLSFAEIKTIAEDEFETHYPNGEGFLRHAETDYLTKDYVLASFLLHQSCERFYYAISLVFTNYKPKWHNLKELSEIVRDHSTELPELFPTKTDFQRNCYDLLCRAYIEARYNKNFRVTKEELEYMLEQTEKLRQITHTICAKQIDSYAKKNNV